ncbi:hypothetical protein RFY41_08110, partial [Acinetobacter soli]|uniref:hypothetical protein n=1 Tax=Acinetobacter soli TaxID=487316 RepID=UPI002813BBB0
LISKKPHPFDRLLETEFVDNISKLLPFGCFAFTYEVVKSLSCFHRNVKMIPKNSLTELAAVPGSLILTAGIP